MPSVKDPFFEPYDREAIAYGEVPSSAITSYLDQVGPLIECLLRSLDCCIRIRFHQRGNQVGHGSAFRR